jgi:hypothetical protein
MTRDAQVSLYVQSGCCKPPTRCGFRFVNATFWETSTKSGGGMSQPAAAVARNDDCRAWSNERQVLCFECDACRAGVLATVNKKWKAVAFFNVALFVVLVVVYTLGCKDGCGAEQT